MSHPKKRVIITGGCGKVGRLVIHELAKTYEILNLDIVRPASPIPNCHTLQCDVTDSGQVFSCLRTYMEHGEPFPNHPPTIPDAVVHLAAIPHPMLVSDGETFRVNVMGNHNVLEAACKLGVKKIILASSVTVYGVAFGQGHVRYASFPVTEDVDTNPSDPYGLSKLLAERTGRSFAARYGVDVYCLRIGRVFGPQEYAEPGGLFESYVREPEKWAAHGWSYTDGRDLGKMVGLAIEVDGLGWQVFNATNDEVTCGERTTELLQRLCPEVKITHEMGEREAPITNRKVKEMLGFRAEHVWKDYVQSGLSTG